jgi:hypothetical protein
VGAAEERLARNEAFFREVNERINDVARSFGGDGDGDKYEFLCECVDLDCVERIPLTLAEYQAVRADNRRFIVARGHVIREIEAVVERDDDYEVVQKVGVAGDVADELAPG